MMVRVCVVAALFFASLSTQAAVVSLSSSCVIGSSSSIKGGERYRLYGLKGLIGEAAGGKPTPVGEPCKDTYNVDVSPAKKDASIAISGEGNALPRPVQMLSNSGKTYREVLGRALAQNGISANGALPSQTLRADLDGDGTMEVLISASKHAGSLGALPKPGDYSVVLLQKIVNGAVKSIPIAGQFNDTAMERYRIDGVLDVDGDGRMEIVIHGRHHEGDWTTIYTLDGDTVKETASCGCAS